MTRFPRPRAALLSCVLPLISAACDSTAEAVPSAGAQGVPPAQRAAAADASGTTLRADTLTVDAPISLDAQLHVEHDAVVAARAAGVVNALHADIGTRVTPGQLLSTVERTEQELAVAQAEVAMEGSARILARLRALARANGATGAEVEAAELRQRETELAVRRARHDLALTRTTAPFAGVVTGRYVRPGRLVAVGDTLFRVTETTRLLARVRVPEGAGESIAVGTPATVIGITGATTTARVVLIAPAVDAASGTREMVLQVAPDTRFLPGASVRVRLGTDRRRVVAVSRDAVGADGYALVLDGDRPTLRAVTLGVGLGGGRVEVVSGLAAGERVARRDR